MALGDILEAVAQSASGGFGSYAQYLESEREKKEREKQRLEDIAFRERQMALQEALAEDARARQRALKKRL